jgi:Flp pilus assembly pilin Flp
MPQTHPQFLVRLSDPRGQTMTEMGVILALVVLIAMVGLVLFSGALQNLWSNLSSTLPGN